MFVQAARELFNMSGEEFAGLYEAGEIPEPDRSEVMRVTLLMLCIERDSNVRATETNPRSP